MNSWPSYQPGPVMRLRVLAATLPWSAYAETVLPVPADDVWAVLSDLEHELPRMVTDIRSARVLDQNGERLTLLARGRLGQRARFSVLSRPHWCWMQSRLLLGGMAVEQVPAGTLVGFLGAPRLPFGGPPGPFVRWAGRVLAARALHRLARDIAAAAP